MTEAQSTREAYSEYEISISGSLTGSLLVGARDFLVLLIIDYSMLCCFTGLLD